MHRKQKIFWAVIVLVVLLIGARIALPEVLQRYVNKTLDSAEGYDGQVGDIDLAIWRGAYVINDVEINKASGDVFAPLFSADEIDISILMSAILRGQLVGEIVLVRPVINFVVEDAEGDQAEESKDEGAEQFGDDANWRQVVTDLFPLRLDLVEIRQGEVHLRKPDSSPPVDVYLTNLNASLRNLTNSRELSDSLVASVDLSADAMRNGSLDVSMQVDPYRELPHFDLDAKLLNLELEALDPLIKAYTPIDLEAGSLDLVVELAARDGQINGYVKPLLRDVKVFEWQEDVEKEGDNIFQIVGESLAGGLANLFENQPRDQLATRIPVEGSLEGPETEVLTAIINILRNAFVRAFEAELEGGVELPGADQSSEETE